MNAVSDEVNTVFQHTRKKIRKVESVLMLSFAVEVKQCSVLGVTPFFFFFF
jgi:cell division protein FtsL